MQNTTVTIDPRTIELIQYIALEFNHGYPELWEGNAEQLVRSCIPPNPTPNQPFHFPVTEGLVAMITQDNRLRVFLEVNAEHLSTGDNFTVQ